MTRNDTHLWTSFSQISHIPEGSHWSSVASVRSPRSQTMLISDCEDTAGTITANLSCRSQTMLISDCEDTAGTITADLRQCWSLTVKIQLPMAGPRMTQGNWLRLVTTYDYSNYQFVCFSNLTQSFWNVGVTSRCIHHSQDPRQTGIIPD